MPGIKKFAVYAQVRALRQMVGDRLDANDFEPRKGWDAIWYDLQALETKLENMDLKEEERA